MFIGSGTFAVPILKALIDSNLLELTCVVTQPPKPVGRNQQLTPTPVGEFMQNSGIKLSVETPSKIRVVAEALLEQYNPELVIVASYGQIIPEILLERPKYKALNIHGSILPLLRGAVPVQISILDGFKETGVSIQQMVFEMDAGPILASKKIVIEDSDTSETLMDKLSLLGADLLLEILPNWISESIELTPQNESLATYCYKSDIAKSNAEIEFNTDIDKAERMVRAFYPWPVAWVNYKGKRIKIFAAVKSELKINSELLEFKKIDKKLYLSLQNGSLEVLELQEEGKKRGTFSDYIYLASLR